MFPGLLTFILSMIGVKPREEKQWFPSEVLFAERICLCSCYLSFSQMLNKLYRHHWLVSNNITQSHKNKAKFILTTSYKKDLLYHFFQNGCVPWNSHIVRKERAVPTSEPKSECWSISLHFSNKCKCQAMQTPSPKPAGTRHLLTCRPELGTRGASSRKKQSTWF